MTKSKDTRKNTYYGLGYYGELATTLIKDIPGFRTWLAMMQRCYDDKYHVRMPHYKGCRVAEEWLNVSNFSKWYEENHYTIDDETIELDKDILVKGNKVYGPNTCIFVPKRINLLFVSGASRRGDLPIGVTYDDEDRVYLASGGFGKKSLKLGEFDTPAEDFVEYKRYKEMYIKQIAEEYKGKIPEKLYNAMLNWQVEITD